MEHLNPKYGPFPAHNVWFALFSILSLLLFGRYLHAFLTLSLRDARYSHVILIPIMSAVLIYLNRRRVFTRPQYCLTKSLLFLAVGVALYYVVQTRLSTLNSNDQLSIVVLAFILVWMAGFMLCYGPQAFRTALFPLVFLVLMVPIPTLVLDKTVSGLQQGSAVMTYALFKLVGVPVFWQHFKFLLPGVEIQIAEECSGIRSSLALFITSILAGQIFLQSNWRRALFSFFTIPIVIFKNAVRIVTISCLGVYVNPGFLYGRLHRYGGLPFSLISLAVLVPSLLALQKSEQRRSESIRTTEEVSQSGIEQDSRVLNSQFN
jgi:exosortase